MDIHVSLKYGPLSVEIDANEEDDYQAEILDILEFVGEFDEQMEILNANPHIEESEEDDEMPSKDQVSIDEFDEPLDEPTQDESEGAVVNKEVLGSLPKKLNASPRSIHKVVDIEPTSEGPPFVLADTDDFGDTKTKRQLTTSLMILAVWDECYEPDRMKSSLLKDALEYSGIDSSNMFNMYHLEDVDAYFDKRGRGGNTTIKLTRPGKREAHKKLRELIG